MNKPRIARRDGHWEVSVETESAIFTARADTIGRALELLQEMPARKQAQYAFANGSLFSALGSVA